MSDTPVPVEGLPQVNIINLPQREGEPTQATFKKVVIGHPYKRGYDRDQYIALAFASELGLVNSSTQIEFAAQPSREDLDSNSSLVIEGFNDKDTSVHTRKKDGNITNVDNGSTPAASNLLNLFRAEKDKLPEDKKKKLDELSNWLRWAENGFDNSKKPKLEKLNEEDLRQLTPIFYGLKAQYSDISQAGDQISQSLQVINDLFDSSRTVSLSEKYSQQIALAKSAEQADFKKIESAVADKSERFKSYILPNGWKVARIDITQVDVEKGGTAFAEKLFTEQMGEIPDLIYMVADERDDKDQ